MTSLIVSAVILVVLSVFALGTSGAEPSHRIVTFNRSSPEENVFERRAGWLRVIGYLGAGLAALLGLATLLKFLARLPSAGETNAAPYERRAGLPG
jgi:hypothetical protein